MLALDRGYTPRRNAVGRIGAVEHTAGVIGQEHRVGLAAIIKNDAFRVLGEDLDEGLGLGGLAGRKGGVANVHRIVCKTVGQTAGPCRALDAVLGHIDPAVQRPSK